MRLTAKPCVALLLLAGGCASVPTLPTLVEQRQVYEQRALGRYETGDLGDAVENFRQALHLAELADDRYALIVDLLNLGSAASDLGRYDEAASAFDRARRIAADEGRGDLVVRALVGQAQLHYRRGERNTARARYQEILDLPATGGDSRVRIMTLNGLLLCALEGGDLALAEGYLRQAEILGDDAATALNRATLALRRGQPVNAEKAARHALELDRAAGNIPGIANDLEVLGETLRLLGREQEAQLQFAQSLALYEQLQAAAAVERVRRRVQP